MLVGASARPGLCRFGGLHLGHIIRCSSLWPRTAATFCGAPASMRVWAVLLGHELVATTFGWSVLSSLAVICAGAWAGAWASAFLTTAWPSLMAALVEVS